MGCPAVPAPPVWPLLYSLHGPRSTSLSDEYSSSLEEVGKVRVGPTGACPAHPIDQEGTMPMLMLSPVSHSWTHPQNIVAAVTDNSAPVKNREPDLTVAKRQTTDHKPSATDAQSLPRKSDSSSG